MMGFGRGMQPVNPFGGYMDCRIKTKGNVCPFDIIIDRFGYSDHPDPLEG